MIALSFRGAHHIVRTLNHSPGGLLVKLPRPPRIGERVQIKFGHGRVRWGVFCWFHAGRAGIRLEP